MIEINGSCGASDPTAGSKTPDLTGINPNNSVFVLLSFEGPDAYSLAGGLGVRAVNLARALARQGFLTHFFFVGDPRLKGEDPVAGGKIILHRWCQWISEYYPDGVYQGETGKLRDFSESIPRFVTEEIVKPAASQGKMVVVLAEEWHTAEAVCRLNERLSLEGLRNRVVMFWNANNTYGFDAVDWARLGAGATLTTVSRYMKHIMWGMGLNPLVIPNGIPSSLLRKVDSEAAGKMRAALDADLVLFKMARWHPDKGWTAAVDAVAQLKSSGLRPVLVARGGMEAYGAEVAQHARSVGLEVREAHADSASLDDHIIALHQAAPADVIDVKFHVPPATSRVLYRASDGVLANSWHEPFGLVGLEAMAAGGITYTGCSGEDYAIPLVNSFVLETDDPAEIITYVNYLRETPGEEERMRRRARRTARQFTWESAIQNLLGKLYNQAIIQGAVQNAAEPAEVPDLHMGATLAHLLRCRVPEVQQGAPETTRGPSAPGPSVPGPSVPGPSVPGPSVPGRLVPLRSFLLHR